jgi:formate/nitrite transporter FocA (FNT family)
VYVCVCVCVCVCVFISANFQHSVVAVTSSCMFRAARRQEDDLDLPYSDTDALNITQVSLAWL